jgi:SAM-dependent methyltransferase
MSGGAPVPGPQAVRGDAQPEVTVDFSALYDAHPEYIARRQGGSFEQAQIDIEVKLLKLPNLLALLPGGPAGPGLASVIEIGCATGELIAAFPVHAGGRRLGIDISAANIAVARARFPHVDFDCGDFRALPAGGAAAADAVILSDVLEHVPDDAAFLRDAAALADIVLVNLPLEDNWLNRRRPYGPDDVSGHLRKYSLADGLALVDRAGLDLLSYRQVWVHETPAEAARRALRRERAGAAFAGAWPARLLRQAVFACATAVRPLGRRLFASNLFVAARRPAAARPAP